jgi:phosphatidylglycerol lysyltransferase
MIVFWQIRDTLSDLYRRAGLHMLKIGEDPIINTRTFTLAGKAMANVRTSVKRAEKEGLHVVFYRGQVQDAEQRTQMERISHAWLASKGGSEWGFSMGRFDPLGDPEQVTVLAVDPANKVHAFVTFVPIYGRNGWGLDLMRRCEQTTPGTMELLLARSIEYFKCDGADMVSLGLAPLNNISHTDKTFLDNSVDFLAHLFGNQSKDGSLYNFKKKFQPCWENRYLVFSSTLNLPKAGWAIYHAHQRDVSLLVVVYRLLREWQAKHQAMQLRKANP